MCGLGGDDRLAPGGGLVPPQAAVVPGGQLTKQGTKRQQSGNRWKAPVGEECWPCDLPVVNHLWHKLFPASRLYRAASSTWCWPASTWCSLASTWCSPASTRLHCTVLESQDSLQVEEVASLLILSPVGGEV